MKGFRKPDSRDVDFQKVERFDDGSGESAEEKEDETGDCRRVGGWDVSDCP